MSIERLQTLVQDFAAQNLPDGKLELLDDAAIKENGLIADLPLYNLISYVHIEKAGKHHMFNKITEQLVLSLTSETNGSNIGILKTIMRRASQEIRKSAIQPAK
jgi:hypothetical protein